MSEELEQELKTLKYGDHVCPIYENINDQIKQRVQFIRQGLKNGNRCLYVADNATVDLTISAFSDAGIDVGYEQSRGALQILTKEDTYFKDGRFDSSALLDFLDKTEIDALKQGFSGLWYLAEMLWVQSENFDSLKLIELEALLNKFLIDRRCVIFCQYTQSDFDLSLIHDVLLTHPLAIFNGLITPNPYFLPPELVLRPHQIATLEFKRLLAAWWIQQLKNMRGSEFGRAIFKQAEHSKESRLRDIMDSLFTFVGILTSDGIVLDINQATLDTADLQREDILGKPFVDTPWWLHSKNTRRHLREALLQAQNCLIIKDDFQINLSDDRLLSIDMTFVPILDSKGIVKEIVISGVDVTKRLETEKALQESELMFRQVVENIEEVFWVSNATKSQIFYISPGFEKIWGYPAESIYADAKIWLAAIHPDDRQRVENSYFEMGEHYNITFRLLLKDGSIRWIRARSFGVQNEEGELDRIVGIAEDITVFRKLEEQFYQSQKMEAVGKLAGGISHDFNNLLAVIKTNAELLLSENGLTPDQADYISEVKKATDRAADLTRQLLLFSRQKQMTLIKLDLNEIIVNVTKMLRRLLGEIIKLKLKLSKKALFVQADATMIDQGLINLIVNARDAMPDGGQLFIDTTIKSFDDAAIPLTPGSRKGSFACIRVSDTGTGIPANLLPMIFEPFFTTKDVGERTGLGLSTIYGHLQQHHGWINVYSEIGIGTTFRIYLPLITDKETLQPKPETKKLEQGMHETIFLVEDEILLRTAIKKVLEHCGYIVIDASNGVSALQIWNDNRDKIDLLLTDFVLPKGINGKELAQTILKDKPSLKIIYMSGYGTEIAGSDLNLQEGVNFLLKPFEPIELSRVLRRCLDGHTKD